MGRWVTIKGRHIYISDEGELKETDKKASEMTAAQLKKYIKDNNLSKKANMIYNTRQDLSIKKIDQMVVEAHQSGKELDDKGNEKKSKLKNQINKDQDTKEKQIAANKRQKDELNSNTKEQIRNKAIDKAVDTEVKAWEKHYGQEMDAVTKATIRVRKASEYDKGKIKDDGTYKTAEEKLGFKPGKKKTSTSANTMEKRNALKQR